MPWAPAAPSPQRSKWPFFFVGLLLYALLTAAVLLWYEDDVEQMAWMDREVFNHKIINQYQLSDNINQDMVIQRLGTPDVTAAVEYNNTVYQLLYYRTHRHAADGITTTDECTALLFKQRRLLAKGEAAVQQYAAVSLDGN